MKKIELKQRGEDKPITIVFNDKGKWDITSPQPYPADPAAVAAVTSGVEKLESERLVDANATDLASYGLAPALLEVGITDKAGKRTNLLIGENTPTGNAVYAKLDGDPRLFTWASGRTFLPTSRPPHCASTSGWRASGSRCSKIGRAHV